MARRRPLRLARRSRRARHEAARDRLVELAFSPPAIVAVGFLGGLVTGATLWSRLVDTNRRGLFSPHPVKRFAAVSYLGARPSVDTARLLRDYILWEPQPLLRRRARRVLRAVEASLER